MDTVPTLQETLDRLSTRIDDATHDSADVIDEMTACLHVIVKYPHIYHRDMVPAADILNRLLRRPDVIGTQLSRRLLMLSLRLSIRLIKRNIQDSELYHNLFDNFDLSSVFNGTLLLRVSSIINDIIMLCTEGLSADESYDAYNAILVKLLSVSNIESMLTKRFNQVIYCPLTSILISIGLYNENIWSMVVLMICRRQLYYVYNINGSKILTPLFHEIVKYISRPEYSINDLHKIMTALPKLNEFINTPADDGATPLYLCINCERCYESRRHLVIPLIDYGADLYQLITQTETIYDRLLTLNETAAVEAAALYYSIHNKPCHDP